MADVRKYYWLKLNKDFFNSKRIKKLRKLAGGDTYTIIYLKMLLLSLDKGGVLEYTGLEDTFAKELALDIDEDEDNVQVTVTYLLQCGLLTTDDDAIEYSLPFVQENTGSETNTAERVRKYRRNKALLQCNTNVTNCNPEIEIEKEIEKEKDIDIDKIKSKSNKFVAPTLDEVSAYCNERHNNVDANRFIDYYTSNGWMVGKNKMKDWKAAVRNWERGNNNTSSSGGDKFMQDLKRIGAEIYGKSETDY